MLAKISTLRPYENGSIFDKFFNNDELFFPSLYDKKEIGKTNIKELDDKYVIDVQIPGFDKKDINLDLEGNLLKISAEISEEKEDGYQRREFYKSSFSRSFTLPENVNLNEIEAESKNGILSIFINKNKEDRKIDRKINIR